ncbi:putative bifunctional diguanylate cyclase/phosphodiesterase [Paraglaciecola arctica]|uniref:putative bifunctional diguanylate cyclase/phosphodiesterase n=1 Tax=Paraglaciecola arctica TaxID=1128911 RepID=UPI001C076602|nr:EAL domain-containing protein [Paraglaciecola arctica]MBU3001999.1 EAL domain-containing protein [Paraglaciecola arctica]
MNVSTEDFEIESDRIALLYQELLGGLLISLIASSGLAFGFMEEHSYSDKLNWFFAMLSVLFLRLIDWFYWKKTKGCSEFKRFQIELYRFRVGSILTAVVWCFYGVYFFNDMALIEFSTTIIILSSMAGGASTVLSADKITSISYSVILLLPISLVGLSSEQPHHYILGMLGLGFSGVMIISGLKSSRFTLQAIKIKHHNERLVQHQDELLHKINQHNEMLEQTVSLRTKEVVRISNIDPLTNLANRKSFSSILKKLIDVAKAEKQKMAVLFIDLDGFKTINDQNGHATGDIVLARVAQRISEITKDKYQVCRWGGDEFIVAMSNVSVTQASSFASELISEIKRPIDLSINSVGVGATVGISIYPEHANTGDDLILLADTAMYEQKLVKNSNVLVFNEQMRENLRYKNRLKSGLEKALVDNQIYVVYQPVIDGQTNKVTFCEALLRWRWGDESIPPDDFIPIAEQYGFIHEIGEWVLNQACKDATRWDIGDQVAISVNVSVAQIMSDDFIKVVHKAITRSGLSPHRLHLEITESLFVENIDKVLKVVKKLQEIGAKVSIDDFGTGFSSLALLQNLSADIVKIDKCFIEALEQGGKAIIQATQHIAQELNYDVVAEGVETIEQVKALNLLGIKNLQGYFFSKPLTYAELNRFMLITDTQSAETD